MRRPHLKPAAVRKRMRAARRSIVARLAELDAIRHDRLTLGDLSERVALDAVLATFPQPSQE